ncbi:MAG: IS4 family transposase [Planctomycetes bacterium]|nr:IS4 family transposase [Planctomycetota bacterium]
MDGSIARSVRQIKADPRAIVSPSSIYRLCQAVGHRWRDRTLGPVETIYLFIAQILHGNTSCAHVRQFGGFAFTRSAYCEARKRLPVQVLRDLLRATGQRVTEHASRVGLWCGHRVVSVDGSAFSMSDTKELDGLFRWAPGNRGHELPVSRFVALFDLITGALLDLAPASMRDHELAIVQRLHHLLRPGDVVVADRLYCAYAYLAQLFSLQLHFVIRVPVGSRRVDFRAHRPHARHGHWKGPQSIWIRRLGKHDQIVDWIKPALVPTWLPRETWEALPKLLRVRELRYRITRRGFRTREVTLVTTLLDPEQYPKKAVAELYGLRWQVETNLRHLKTTMRMDVLRCQTLDGISRELAVFGIVYNAVRLVMINAAEAQGVPPDHISFIDVLRWLELGCPGRELPRFLVNPRRCRSPAPRQTRRRPRPLRYLTGPRTPQRNLSNDQHLLLI